MSFVSTIASVLYAALPQQLRRPARRKSEGEREFDVLIDDLRRAETVNAVVSAGVPITLTCAAWDGPTRAVVRRARN